MESAGAIIQLHRPDSPLHSRTGILVGEWELAGFRPMEHIPTSVRLTGYSSGATDIVSDDLQRYVTMVEKGELEIRRGPVWTFRQLQEAHRAMEEDRANGKMVVAVDTD